MLETLPFHLHHVIRNLAKTGINLKRRNSILPKSKNMEQLDETFLLYLKKWLKNIHTMASYLIVQGLWIDFIFLRMDLKFENAKWTNYFLTGFMKINSLQNQAAKPFTFM